ncbi:MAG: hypothetical protein MUF08_16570 [Burkholderiaceae bacterium]|jgi:hypothetical protein|nr:hypothetical protein [Burkholderiaceae bacterium]
MNYRTSRLLVGIATLSCTFAAAAAPIQHACESWHPRLGQAPDDFKFALDLAAKRCSGEPCTITDKELTWSIQGGRYTVTINRLTNEGQMIREGELLAVLKNCRPA